MLRVEPGREEEFEALRAWLAASAALDRLVEATDALSPGEPDALRHPLPRLLAASHRDGLASGTSLPTPSLEAINP